MNQTSLRVVREEVILVDTSNYSANYSGEIEEIEQGISEGRWIEKLISRPVIKSLNTMHYATLVKGRSATAGDRIAFPVSGGDEAAKKVVMNLINDIGFDAVDAGNLDGAWRHQLGTPAFCTNLTASEMQEALFSASKERLCFRAAYCRSN